MNKISANSDPEIPIDFRVVELSREPIELYKILKFEGLVGSGGEAKMVIASGQVLLNGKIETRKRKKIVSGDSIEFGGKIFRINFSSIPNDNVDPKITKIESGGKIKAANRKAFSATAKGNRTQ